MDTRRDHLKGTSYITPPTLLISPFMRGDFCRYHTAQPKSPVNRSEVSFLVRYRFHACPPGGRRGAGVRTVVGRDSCLTLVRAPFVSQVMARALCALGTENSVGIAWAYRLVELMMWCCSCLASPPLLPSPCGSTGRYAPWNGIVELVKTSGTTRVSGGGVLSLAGFRRFS